MKLYKESVRRLSRIGLTLLVVCVIMSVIVSAQVCGEDQAMLLGPLDMMPVLIAYVFAGGLGLAFVGFSFLNRRSDSDFYHSLPLKRTDIFLSVTLAALTWIAATVLLCVLSCALVYGFTGTPSVPAYYPLAALYFIVATMLVFAAAAIGCTITGTFFTNVILTLLVLFLPRYILFLLGRAIVENAGIVGWLDLNWFLDPSTNIATGLVVMYSRTMVRRELVDLLRILYSMALMLAELGLAGVLFVRRPSELAEQGAKNPKLQTIFACLLALPVLLLSLARGGRLTGLFVLILFVASFAAYVIYQIIVLRSLKKVLLSLPWYLCSVALTVCLFFGVRLVSSRILGDCPAPGEIASVTFNGMENDRGVSSYTRYLVSKIPFTDEGVISYTAETLEANVETVRLRQANNQYGSYYNYNERSVIAPVTITLKSGRKLSRTIEFASMDILNNRRETNAEYAAAIRSFPPADSVHYYWGYSGSDFIMDQADVEKLRACYFDECEKAGVVISDNYIAKPVTEEKNYQNSYCDEDQTFGSFTIGGYVGSQRYLDYYNITLATPKTASLWMMLNNAHADGELVPILREAFDYTETRFLDSDYFNVNFSFTNVPMKNGMKQQLSMGYYIYGSHMANTNAYARPYVKKIIDVLLRGTPTVNPNEFNVTATWNAQFGNEYENRNGACFLAFSKEDEKQLLELIAEWRAAEYNENLTGQENYGEIAVDSENS